jgi:anti-anti-sigma regulatory factor
MFDIDLARDSGRTLLRLKGDLQGPGDTDRLNEVFTFVQPDDHLVLDLTQTTAIDDSAAMLLQTVLMTRAVMAENVVVSPRERVSLELALHDIDRVSLIVFSVEDALAVLESRWAGRRHLREREHSYS